MSVIFQKIEEAKQVEQEKSDFEFERKKRDQMKEEAVRFAEIAAERERVSAFIAR